MLWKENTCYLPPQWEVGEKQPCFSDFFSHSSDPSPSQIVPLHPFQFHTPHCRHSPIRKSMYPSPPLSTRTFFSFCPSVSVAAVLGFSEGLSNTLPFKVARTLPGTGQRCHQCHCSALRHSERQTRLSRPVPSAGEISKTLQFELPVSESQDLQVPETGSLLLQVSLSSCLRMDSANRPS